MKALYFAKTTADTFLSCSAGVARDTTSNANPSLLRATSNGLAASVVVPDSVPPSLVSFILDESQNTLKMSFDDIMTTTGMVLGSITLQNSADGSGGQSLPLTGGVTSGDLTDTITIALNVADTIALKAMPTFASSQGTIFMSFSSSAVTYRCLWKPSECHCLWNCQASFIIHIWRGWAAFVGILDGYE